MMLLMSLVSYKMTTTIANNIENGTTNFLMQSSCSYNQHWQWDPRDTFDVTNSEYQ